MILARDCLEKARFFAEKARAVEVEDRTQFRYFFETAIVWARSVTLLLQKEYSNTPGFEAWYENQQTELAKDTLAQFFLEQRNFTLKEGPVSLRKIVNIVITANVTVKATVKLKVIRGSWRSRLRHFPEDFLRPVMQKLGMMRKRLKPPRDKPESNQAVATEHLYFAHAPWDKEPALDLFGRYLGRLESLVNSAIKQFGKPGKTNCQAS